MFGSHRRYVLWLYQGIGRKDVKNEAKAQASSRKADHYMSLKFQQARNTCIRLRFCNLRQFSRVLTLAAMDLWRKVEENFVAPALSIGHNSDNQTVLLPRHLDESCAQQLYVVEKVNALSWG